MQVLVRKSFPFMVAAMVGIMFGALIGGAALFVSSGPAQTGAPYAAGGWVGTAPTGPVGR